MILEKNTDITNPKIIPFLKNEWQPMFDALKKYFTMVKEDDSINLSDNANKFIDNAIESLSNMDDDKVDAYKIIYLLFIEKRFDEVLDSNIEEESKKGETSKEIGKKTPKYYKYLKPEFENIDIEGGLRLKDLSENWRVLLWLDAILTEKKSLTLKYLNRLSELMDRVIDKQLTFNKVNEKLLTMKKTFPQITEITGVKEESLSKNTEEDKPEKDDNSSDNESKTEKDDNPEEKEDTDIKYFFNNVATPDADLDKLTSFILEDIKKKGFTSLDSIEIEICSNGLRNTATAENISFEELNNNRYENTKKSIVNALSKYKETEKDINIDPEKIVFSRKKDWSINKKIGNIEQVWKVNSPNGLVGPPSPYEKMLDVNGTKYNYYKVIGKTLNIISGLDGKLPVGLIMETKSKNLSTIKTNLPDNQYSFGIDKLVNSHIFILDIDPNVVTNNSIIKSKLLSSVPIAISEITKDTVKNFLERISGKTIYVNFNTIKGAAQLISKLYEPLNILKVEWKGSKISSSTEKEKKEDETPKSKSNRKIKVSINTNSINKCAYECDLSVA